MHEPFCYGLLTLLPAVAVVSGTMIATPGPTTTFVYVGNAESNEIYVLKLDRQNGDLTMVEKVSIPGITSPGISTPMAISPDRRYLYVGTRGDPKIVAGFAIDPVNGTLKHVASGPLADSRAAYLATDRTGRFLFGASYPGHKITVNPIGARGAVQTATSSFAGFSECSLDSPRCGNRHVLALTLGNDLVNLFTFNEVAIRGRALSCTWFSWVLLPR